MTISGGQILHKAVYPGSFPQIQKREPAMRKFLSSFLFYRNFMRFGNRKADTVFQKERNKNRGISKMVQQNVLLMTPIYISS